MEYTFIYPNQLFEVNPAVSKSRKVLLVEDPLFYGDLEYPLKFHKKKLMLHYLSIRSYCNKLKIKGYKTEIIHYLDLKRNNHIQWILKKYKIKIVHISDVTDFVLKKRIETAVKSLGVSVKWYDNPNFLLTLSDVHNDFYGKKRHFMATFYKKQRKRYDILLEEDGKPLGGHWSYDVENRKKLPKNIEIPSDMTISYDCNTYSSAKKFIEKNFSDNFGNIENFNYPIDHEQAKRSFHYFLNEKFQHFGPYEDALSKKNSVLFHSVLTPYLNIGLISPSDVIQALTEYSKENLVPINSHEGFIRQIIGWREFIRGIYLVDGVKQRTNNFWKFSKKIPQSFYDANTGIEPVDRSIEKLLDGAYLHHIERLMIMGNIFFLLKIDPNEIYNWFMELFIDAYDWVMVPNVYGMSQYSDGGLMSTKPYISGSNYILKMSDYKKGDWCKIWDALYWNFINEERVFFKKNPRMSMMINMYDKKPADLKSSYKNLAENLTL